jgi:hypothetical protein
VVTGRLSPPTASRRTLLAVAAAAAVARRPRLWPVALHQVRVLARPGWWRNWPPSPFPDPAYLRFRLQVAYGDDPGALDANDVVGYLEWCRQMRRLRQW